MKWKTNYKESCTVTSCTIFTVTIIEEVLVILKIADACTCWYVKLHIKNVI